MGLARMETGPGLPVHTSGTSSYTATFKVKWIKVHLAGCSKISVSDVVKTSESRTSSFAVLAFGRPSFRDVDCTGGTGRDKQERSNSCEFRRRHPSSSAGRISLFSLRMPANIQLERS